MVNDYRDWGIQMGRRFRALKLWFVIRNFGVDGIKEKVNEHITLAKNLAEKIKESGNFILFEPQHLNVVCFRYQPGQISNAEELNQLNQKLMHKLNESGEIYITHTKVKGLVTLRMVIAQTYVQEKHVAKAWELIKKTAITLGAL
jgi:aromatic-L-amino-acid decarboxylase